MEKSQRLAGGIALLVSLAILFGVFAETAPAAQIVGSDGQVYACYKAKGKRKGSVRLVGKTVRCKRGERKTSWSASGAAGTPGQSGAGTAGGSGGSGTNGAPGSLGVVELNSKLLDLTLKLDQLEGILKGVTNDTLTKALDTVKGITNGELLAALGSLDAVDLLCTQADKLTDQVGLLGNTLGGLGLNGVLSTLGGLLSFGVPIPVALPAFSCDDAT